MPANMPGNMVSRLDEAMQRLRAQQESVAATDRLRDTYRDRLAGIVDRASAPISHRRPADRHAPVARRADRRRRIGRCRSYSAPAPWPPAQIRAAIAAHQAEILAALPPRRRASGLDPRTGALVVMVKAVDGRRRSWRRGPSGSPRSPACRCGSSSSGDARPTSSIDGGRGIVGTTRDGRRFACTTGFVVTDGTRSGIVTAAHCPYSLTYSRPTAAATPLNFVGAWGARYQDVQVHAERRGAAAPILCRHRQELAAAGDRLAQPGEHARRRLRLPSRRADGL